MNQLAISFALLLSATSYASNSCPDGYRHDSRNECVLRDPRLEGDICLGCDPTYETINHVKGLFKLLNNLHEPLRRLALYESYVYIWFEGDNVTKEQVIASLPPTLQQTIYKEGNYG